MLDANLTEQLKTYLGNLREPIELVASLGHDPKSSETKQLLETIAGLSDNGFVVVWQSEDHDRVYAQRYRKSGQRRKGEYRTSRYKEYGQTNPTVAGLPGKNFVVTWESDHDNNGGLGTEIYGQRIK